MDRKDRRVSVIRCEDYDISLIKECLKEGLKPFGGIESFVKPGQKVLLKANLLMAKDPEEMVTTHPAVVQAVAELVLEAEGLVIIGDSPGGPFTKSLLQVVYKRTGMEKVATLTGAELNWECGSVERKFSDGKVLKKLTLGKYITDADVIINLPKLKTHGMTKMTGGVKNLFGAVPGLIKAEYHLKMQKISDFSDALIDIALGVAPQLTIMDGIIGMEGEGPSGGTPKKINTLLISPDPFALDVVMASLAGINPEDIPTIKMAKTRNLPASIADIEIIGEKLVSLKPESFKSPDIDYTAKLLERKLPVPIARWLTKVLSPKPIFDLNQCIQCGNCIRSCPPQVIKKKVRGVEADLSKCIRCFCCQELCPEKAVSIYRPLLGRLLFKK